MAIEDIRVLIVPVREVSPIRELDDNAEIGGRDGN